LHELQVGGASQPSLDVILIIVCGLGTSKQIWPGIGRRLSGQSENSFESLGIRKPFSPSSELKASVDISVMRIG